MHKTKSFSLYAFIIAVLVHLVAVLLLAFIEKITPPPPPPPVEKEKPAESRFKLSLKERPQAPKEALVKNDIPKISKARPMPKGEQLQTPTPQHKPQPKLETKPQPAPSLPMPQSVTVPKETTLPESKKAFERHVAKEVAAIERKPQPKKEFSLYDTFSKADPEPRASSGSMTKVSDSIQKLYGDKFGELSEGEQKYILDNQEVMRRITQSVLDRYGRSKIPDHLRVDETNMIEFYLHPDGHISDIRFLKNSRFAILDDTTKETIEIAYGQYPRPAQKTLIRYRVWYNLR
ncbi:MAG TPA: hypothetical protein VFX57_02480 [Sulfuricurvum sp.]|nr:hypothetical protein [Sulfuricurvum sp.]